MTLYSDFPALEHIKYPDSNRAPQPANGQPGSRRSVAQQPTQQQPSGSPMSSSVINGARSMSPNAQQSPDPEEIRRAISPPNGKSSKLPNGIVQQGFSSKDKGKAPMRPKREDEEIRGIEESMERAASPEQTQAPVSTRAKSPTQLNAVGRAASPVNVNAPVEGQQPSIAGVAMGLNGLAARSASPSTTIDRTKPPADAFYNPDAPNTNGFIRSHSRNGSVGNMSTDVIRDLKAKEAELEAMKKRELWMKEALLKATRSGFVYPDRDSSEAEALGLNGGAEETSDQRVMEMALKFKQFRAQIQVRSYV